MEKIKVRFPDSRNFTCHEEVWAYLEGFCLAIGHEGVQWSGLEFENLFYVDNVKYSSMIEWIREQG